MPTATRYTRIDAASFDVLAAPHAARTTASGAASGAASEDDDVGWRFVIDFGREIQGHVAIEFGSGRAGHDVVVRLGEQVRSRDGVYVSISWLHHDESPSRGWASSGSRATARLSSSRAQATRGKTRGRCATAAAASCRTSTPSSGAPFSEMMIIRAARV